MPSVRAYTIISYLADPEHFVYLITNFIINMGELKDFCFDLLSREATHDEVAVRTTVVPANWSDDLLKSPESPRLVLSTYTYIV